MSAIDAQVAARHEAAGVAEQEHGGTAVLAGLAEPVEHVVLGPLDLALRVLHEERLDHGGDDVAGRDGVDADAVSAPFGSQVTAELQDGGLGGVVCAIVAVSVNLLHFL